jgi:Outer membrane protein beta-barrel domain
MKRFLVVLFWVSVFAIPSSAWAQDDNQVPWNLRYDPKEATRYDNPRVTTNIGMPLSVPLSPTSQYVSWGLGMNVGAGYNFDRQNALVGEFMWNYLYPTSQTLGPIQAALNTDKVSGHGNVFALTGGYKLELRGRALGTYLILGGGWYFRTASLSRSIPDGTAIGCVPAWVWWGYNCSSGLVVSNLTEIHSNTNAPGVNGGIGMTFRVGEAPFRVYVETRYHFAPTKNISTQLITINWGIRY